MKRLISISVLVLLMFFTVACSSDHTQEEYDQLLAEKNDLQTQYDELSSLYDPLYTSNQEIQQAIDDLNDMIADRVFNDDIYNVLTSESYQGANLQDQRLWGTYSTDKENQELLILYCSGLMIKLYMPTGSEGQYFLDCGSYSFDPSNNQLSLNFSGSLNIYKASFTDTGIYLKLIDGSSYDEWTWIRLK
ncbi:MAG: hypothetical protein VB012_04620 [Erysipelotrichaceae bacterium]|nr:hypothetical protein [Erysipelotrichaceae bacterium]